MSPDDLDLTYTYLCNALGRVGESEAVLFLAMVSLSLISRQTHPDSVIPLIDRSEAACRNADAALAGPPYPLGRSERSRD